MRFIEDLTPIEKSNHLDRYVKGQYHDSQGNIIISRKVYEKDTEDTERAFQNRLKLDNRDKYEKGLSAVNEPKLFDGCSLEEYHDKKFGVGFVDRMKQRAENNDSFWIMGKFGSGKSRLAWAYAKYLYLERGNRDIVVIRFSDIFKNTKMNYGTFEYNDYFMKMCSCKILIIDDIRKMDGRTSNHYEAFVDLLDARLEQDCITGFTSNVGFRELAGDEVSSMRIATRIERVLKSKSNIEIFKEKFYEF